MRQGVARVGATQVPKVVPAKPDAGATFDLNKQLILPSQKTPDVPVASTVPPFRDVADPNSSIASWLSGASSLPFAGTGELSAVKAQTGAIARTMDAGRRAHRGRRRRKAQREACGKGRPPSAVFRRRCTEANRPPSYRSGRNI